MAAYGKLPTTFVGIPIFSHKSYFRRMQEMPKKISFVALFHAKKIKLMKNPIWRNGIYSMLIILGVFTAIQVIWGFTIPYRTSEVIGYLTIFISLAFVFLGIRAYRDEKNGGEITFGKALQIGLLITIFPSTAFSLFTMVEFLLQGEEMMEYYKQNMPAADRQQWGENMEILANPFFQGMLMFVTVFLIGLIISIISAMILKRQAVPA